jgi:hypothetical protein
MGALLACIGWLRPVNVPFALLVSIERRRTIIVALLVSEADYYFPHN